MVSQSERTLLLRVLGDTDSASGAIRALRSDVQGTGQEIDGLGEHFQHLRESGEAVGKVNLGPLKSDIGDLAGIVPGLGGAFEHAGVALEHLNADAKSGQSEAALLAGGIGGIGVAAAAISFETFENGVHSIHLLAEETGLSEEKVAGFQLSLREAGLGADVANTSIMMVQRNLLLLNQNLDEGKEPTGNFSKGLQALGIDINSTAVRSGELSQLLPIMADRFKAEKEQAEANGTAFNGAGIAIELFGRRGAAMVPVLEQGSEGLKKNEAFVKSLGLANEEQVKHLEAWETASARAEVAATALGAKIGSDVAPALTAVAKATSDALSFLDKMPGSLSAVVIGLPLLAAGTIAGAAGLAKMFDIAGTGISALVNVGGAIGDFASKSLVARDAGMAAAEGEAAVGTASATAGAEARAGAAGFETLATAEAESGKAGTGAAGGEATAGTAAATAGDEAASGAVGFGTLATAEGTAGKAGTGAAEGEAAAGAAAATAGDEAAGAASKFSLLSVPLGLVAGILGGALVAGLVNSRDTMKQEASTVQEAQIQHAQLTALLAREVQQHGENSSAAKELRARIAELDSAVEKLSGTQASSTTKMQQGVDFLRSMGVDVEHLGKVHLATADDVKKAGDEILKEENQVRDATHAAVMAEIGDKTVLAEAERRIATQGGILTQEQITDIRNLAQENQARADKAEAAANKAAAAWKQETDAANSAAGTLAKDSATMAATYEADAEKMGKAFSGVAEKTRGDWEQIKETTQRGAQQQLAVMQSLQGEILGLEQQLTVAMSAEDRKRLESAKSGLEGQLAAARTTFNEEVSEGSQAVSKLAELDKKTEERAKTASNNITKWQHDANVAALEGKQDESAGYLQAIELEKQGDYDGAQAAIDAAKEKQDSAKQTTEAMKSSNQEQIQSFEAGLSLQQSIFGHHLAIQHDMAAMAQVTGTAEEKAAKKAVLQADIELQNAEIALDQAKYKFEMDQRGADINFKAASTSAEIALAGAVVTASQGAAQATAAGWVSAYGSIQNAATTSATNQIDVAGAIADANAAAASAVAGDWLTADENAITDAQNAVDAAASAKQSAEDTLAGIQAAQDGVGDSADKAKDKVNELTDSLSTLGTQEASLGETLRSVGAEIQSQADTTASMNANEEDSLNRQIASLQVKQDRADSVLRTERNELRVLQEADAVLKDETDRLNQQLSLQEDILHANPEYETLRGKQLEVAADRDGLELERDRLVMAGQDTAEIDKQIQGLDNQNQELSDELKLLDDQNKLQSFGLQKQIDTNKVVDDRNKLRQNEIQTTLDQAKAEDDVTTKIAEQIQNLQDELKLLQDIDKTVAKIASTAASTSALGGTSSLGSTLSFPSIGGAGGSGGSVGAANTGGLGGSTRKLAEGGVLDEPVFGIGARTGMAYSIAESGPEAVVPMGGGGSAPALGLPGTGGPTTIEIHLHDTRIMGPGDVSYWADLLSSEIYKRLQGQSRMGARV
jgi:predicted nucleic acid-binding protein